MLFTKKLLNENDIESVIIRLNLVNYTANVTVSFKNK